MPLLFTLALTNELVHVVEHLVFIGAGVLFWWPMIRATGAHARRRLDEPQVVLYMLAGMVPMMAVATVLSASADS